jgi:ABC-type Fe3+ transport system permease subunit
MSRRLAAAAGLLIAAIATSYDSQGRQWRVTLSTAPIITMPVPAGGFAIVQR